MTDASIRQKRSRRALVSLFFAAVAVLACCTVPVLKTTIDSQEDSSALEEVSARLGIARNWPSVHEWLEQRLKVGLTRAQVREMFQSIGNVEISTNGFSVIVWDRQHDPDPDVEYVRFTSSALDRNMRWWLFRYDDQDRLVNWARLDS
jgi:hypothetical protein